MAVPTFDKEAYVVFYHDIVREHSAVYGAVESPNQVDLVSILDELGPQLSS